MGAAHRLHRRDARRGAGQGGAFRAQDFGGDDDEGRSVVDDGRDPLGVAIRLGRHVPGSINLTRSLRSPGRDRAAATLAGPARDATREIPDALAHGIRFTR